MRNVARSEPASHAPNLLALWNNRINKLLRRDHASRVTFAFAIVTALKTPHAAMCKPHNACPTRIFAVLLMPCVIRTPFTPPPAVSSKPVAAANAAA